MAFAAPDIVLAPRFTEEQLDTIADPAFVVDHAGRIIAWNGAAQALLGWKRDAAMGATCAALLEGRTADGQECTAGCSRAAGYGCPGINCAAHPDLRIRTISGRELPVAVVELPIILEGQPALLHILREVPEPHLDPLTGLVGRHEFAQALLRAQSAVRRTGEALSIALVDLDHLKRINDRFGHAAGDMALMEVAATLREGRGHDHVARWGGDEFLLLAVGATPEATVTRLERCIHRLGQVRVNPAAQPLSISAGVTAVHPDDVLDEIVGRADTALYQAKGKRATVRIAGRLTEGNRP